MAKRSASRESGPDDYVSMWFWMFAQFLLMLPLINLVAVPILAFVGQNRSRKNFFRALLMWVVLIFALHITLFLVAFSGPPLFQWFKDLWSMILDLIPTRK
ncbi:MAG: hypothetical protein QM790_00670 [Nibricoccus sp.]